jgi:hypothetical protein
VVARLSLLVVVVVVVVAVEEEPGEEGDRGCEDTSGDDDAGEEAFVV